MSPLCGNQLQSWPTPLVFFFSGKGNSAWTTRPPSPQNQNCFLRLESEMCQLKVSYEFLNFSISLRLTSKGLATALNHRHRGWIRLCNNTEFGRGGGRLHLLQNFSPSLKMFQLKDPIPGSSWKTWLGMAESGQKEYWDLLGQKKHLYNMQLKSSSRFSHTLFWNVWLKFPPICVFVISWVLHPFQFWIWSVHHLLLRSL